jgi:formate hydrogenlyase subunit 3/multisubunit Na+/H+ antiporter MnhD subunit
VFFLYFFHELALIPTFIMVGIWGGRDRSYAAIKMTIYLTVGAMISLVGLIALYVKSGARTFDLITLKAHLAAHPLAETVQHNIFGLLALGLGILVSLWPLHTWAPLGYGAAPSSNAMLHAGVLKKFGLYTLVSGRAAAPARWCRALVAPAGVAGGGRQRAGGRSGDHRAAEPKTDDRLQLRDAHGLRVPGPRGRLGARRQAA